MPPRRRARGLAVSLAVVLSLGACSGGGGNDSTGAADPTTSTSAATSPETASPTTAPSAWETSTSSPVVPTTKPDTGPEAFRAPSGNIGCYIDESSARCDVVEYDWSPPPKPADCDLDWGGALAVDAEGPVHLCRGDTVLGAHDVLAYGAVARRGAIECTSAQTGVTCTYSPTGRGFTISRRAFRFF